MSITDVVRILSYPKKLNIRQCEDDGKMYVSDVLSSHIFEIDELMCDILKLCGNFSADEIIRQLCNRYDIKDIAEALEDLEELEQSGFLSTMDEYPQSENNLPYKLHLVSHIHWDREWYLTFQQSRARLVDLVEHVLNILDNHPEFRYYTFDGQTVLLEDYLEIRPERESKLIEYIQQGRILIGPWYIQTDEFLVSGESLIRNLMLGKKNGEKFGGIMKVGYLPDTPGHILQLPQILRGFDIDNAFIYRGISMNPRNPKSEIQWASPDGSTVLLIYMPHGFNLANTEILAELPGAYGKIINIKKESCQHTTTSHLLLMSNTFNPLDNVSKRLSQLNSLMANVELIHSCLPNYIEALKQSNVQWEVIHGELRDCRSVCIFPGVLSSRMQIKQQNERTQNCLEKWAEPFATIAWMFGAEYPDSYLWLAWKYLLQNQSEDSIRGCHIDAIEHQMQTRFAFAQEIAEDVTERSLKKISEMIDTSEYDNDSIYLVVFNPLSWTRTDYVTATVNVPWERSIRKLTLYDIHGEKVPFQIVKCTTTAHAQLEHLVRPIHRWTKQVSLAFIADDVPSCGYKTYRLAFHDTEENGASSKPLNRHAMSAENAYLKIEMHDNGTLTLTDKRTGKSYYNLNQFEDRGDAGDLYTFSPPLLDTPITSINEKALVQMIEDGPVYTRFKIEFDLQLPQQLSPEELVQEEILIEGHALDDVLETEPQPARVERAQTRVSCRIISYVTLAKESSRLDIATTVTNKAKEHRLRVLFPSHLKTDSSYADTPFAIVERPINLIHLGGEEEDASPIYPLSNFVDVSDGEKGLAIISKGLPEYEVKNDEHHSIALTLLRCVGWLNRDILYNRRRHLAPSLPTPDAQCIGTYSFNYSIAPHIGSWKDAKIYRQAYQHNVPMRVIQTDAHTGTMPLESCFLSIEPAELLISAVKKSEKEQAIIIRLYNITAEDVQGKLNFYKPIKSARFVNLNEEYIDATPVQYSDGYINFTARSSQIITLEIFH